MGEDMSEKMNGPALNALNIAVLVNSTSYMD
jgi:hypothetical protein